MRRLTHAPNLALASLWRDMLAQAGFAVSVQRAYASSIAGEIPPDQALPEIWIDDDSQFDAARALLDAVAAPGVAALGLPPVPRAQRRPVRSMLAMRRTRCRHEEPAPRC